MPRICLPTNELTSRIPTVQALLSPLRKQGKPVGCGFDRGLYQGSKVLGAHDALGAGVTYKDWLFRSYVHSIFCQYFEIWQPFQGGKSVCLSRAYLSLHSLDRDGLSTTRREILSVHCDPQMDLDKLPSRYKCGPHLHVKATESRISRCHFPLNLGHLDAVLASAESLTDAIGDAIEVVTNEVLKSLSGKS